MSEKYIPHNFQIPEVRTSLPLTVVPNLDQEILVRIK